MMCAHRARLLSWILVTCCVLTGPYHCDASEKKTSCYVEDGQADCSRLRLSAIPSDLPRNITSLDVSHNILRGITPLSLSVYPGLLHLDAGYNSITKVDAGLCQTLPLLQMLNLEHNQVHLLKTGDMSHCTRLTSLNLASNRLKLQGEPFSSLQVLMCRIT